MQPALTVYFKDQLLLGASEDHRGEDRSQWLYQALRALKDVDRGLMILLLEGHSYEEIAEIMGLTKSNVATRISRAKSKLKELKESKQWN